MGGLAPVNPDGYFICYTIFDDFLGCYVTSYPRCDSSQLVEELKNVFSDIHSVLTGKNFKK